MREVDEAQGVVEEQGSIDRWSVAEEYHALEIEVDPVCALQLLKLIEHLGIHTVALVGLVLQP